MKKKKIFLGLALALTSILTITSCGNSNDENSTGSSSTVMSSKQGTETSSTASSNVASSAESTSSIVASSAVDASSNIASSSNAIQSSSQGQSELCTVKFETNGGSSINDINIEKGSKLTKPNNPTKEADNNNTYEFVCWCKDINLTTEFNFENEVIETETTLYAKFASVSNDTTIKMNGTNYATIAAALAAIPANSTDTFVITLPKGTYNENGLTYDGSATIKIKGNTTAKYGSDVIITGRGSDMGQEKKRNLISIQGTANIILENLTLVSDYTRLEGGSNAQAEVLGTDTTGYTVAYNCAFKSHQDTVRTIGKAWFYGCYIEGDTDFIWMERAGIVALYENCEIVSVYDENHSAHETIVAAPRMTINSKVGKGLVIYNSTIKESDEAKANGQKTYLARSLGSGCYDQVAYINTQCSDVEAKVWKNNQNETEFSKTAIGWKLDQFTADSLGYAGNGDILSTNDVANEFSGRKTILNRVYNTNKIKYEKDAANNWDIDKVINDNNFLVDFDSSSDTLEGEVTGKTTVYNFDGTEDLSQICNGFKQDGTKAQYAGNSGATITIPVSGKCYVEIYGYNSGTIEAKADTQGEAIMFFNNKDVIENDYIVFNENTTSVVLTAKAKTYITKIVVVEDNSISETKVSDINITTSTSNYVVGVACTLTAKIANGDATNKSVKWKSNNTDVADIDEYTGVVTFKTAGEASFTATACDGSNVTKDFTCTVEEASWTAAEWYTTDGNADSSNETTATNIKYFTPSSDQYAALVSNQTFKNLAGKDITTGKGVKLNSSTDTGALKVATVANATLTIMIAPRSGGKPTAAPKVVCGSTTATLLSTSTNGDITTYVFSLNAVGEWVISRGDTSTENNPIIYAKCVYDAVWDFQNQTPATITTTNIQGTTGTIVSNHESISLEVDATCTNGKLEYNSQGYAQFNNGTIIKVPVVNVGSIITVVSYPGQSKYTIGSGEGQIPVDEASNTDTYTVTAADVEAGYVEIIATGGAYIYSISLSNPR